MINPIKIKPINNKAVIKRTNSFTFSLRLKVKESIKKERTNRTINQKALLLYKLKIKKLINKITQRKIEKIASFLKQNQGKAKIELKIFLIFYSYFKASKTLIFVARLAG